MEKKFEFGQAVKIARTGEIGTVEGLATYRAKPPMALLRYKQADGRAGEAWFDHEELEAA